MEFSPDDGCLFCETRGHGSPPLLMQVILPSAGASPMGGESP